MEDISSLMEIFPQTVPNLLLLLVLAVITVYTLQIHFTKTVRRINKLPGPRATPFIGHAHTLANNEARIQILMNWRNTYGTCFRFFTGYRTPVVCLTAPVDVQRILGSMEKQRKSSMSKALVSWFGKGILMATGTRWQQIRKLSAPGFHPSVLARFVPTFNKYGRQFAQILETTAAKISVTDVCPHASDCALKAIFETSFEVSLETLGNASQIIEATIGLAEAIVVRVCRPWLEPDFLWNLSSYGRQEKAYLHVMKNIVAKVIAARKTELKNDDCSNDEASIGKGSEDLIKKRFENESSRKPFLDLLIQRQREGHEVLEDDIIRDTALTVTAAGHDTAANTISWAMFFIGSDSEIQRIIHAELDDLFLENRNREITLDDVSRMKYLESCIHETLRLVPAFPHILRYIHEDIKLDDGTVLPAGADAFVFIYGLHRNQETFPDPEKFDPSRFFPENSRGRHPYSYVPFSAGPKSCLGYRYAIIEMKIFLAHVFRQFWVTAVDRLQDIGLLPDLVLRPKAGIRVTLKHRL